MKSSTLCLLLIPQASAILGSDQKEVADFSNSINVTDATPEQLKDNILHLEKALEIARRAIANQKLRVNGEGINENGKNQKESNEIKEELEEVSISKRPYQQLLEDINNEKSRAEIRRTPLRLGSPNFPLKDPSAEMFSVSKNDSLIISPENFSLGRLSLAIITVGGCLLFMARVIQQWKKKRLSSYEVFAQSRGIAPVSRSSVHGFISASRKRSFDVIIGKSNEKRYLPVN